MSTITRHIAMILAIAISTCVLTVPLNAAEITWDAEGTDTHWSTSANWNPDDTDPSGDDIGFDNSGLAASPTVTNKVDQDYTVPSLSYRNISSSQWHTTDIPDGVTLTISGTTGDNLVVGDHIDPSDPDTKVTIAGGGTLVFDNADGYILVRNGGDEYDKSHATLDLSGLNSFEATASEIRVAGDPNESGQNRSGTLSLATSNRIDADTLCVGGYASDKRESSYLYLGQSNDLYVGTIKLGSVGDNYDNEGKGYVSFQTGLENAEVTIRGNDGEDSRADMYLGTINASIIAYSRVSGYVDFTDGTVDAKLNNLRIGYDHQYTSLPTGFQGSFSFDSGEVDANTIALGRSNGTAGPSGTLSVGASGTLHAGSITLGNANGNRAATGTLNLNGTLEATTVILGAGSTPVSATATLNFNGGTIRNKADTNLTISSGSGSTATFNLAGPSASHVFDAQDGYTITVDSVMSGDGGFTKTGLGTLDLIEDNTYTGNTTVNAGTLKLSHSSSNNIADSPVITVNAGGTLDVTGLNSGAGLILAGGQTLTGTGTVTGTTTVAPAAQLAPGSSPGILYTDDLELGGGSISLFDIWGPTAGSGHDQVIGGSEANLTLNENWVLNLDIHPQEPITGTLTLFDFGDYSGDFEPIFNFVRGRADVYEFNPLDGTIYFENAIPEPASLALLGLGALALLRRRRK